MKLNATRETRLAMEIRSTFHAHILSVFAGYNQPSFAIVRVLCGVVLEGSVFQVKSAMSAVLSISDE